MRAEPSSRSPVQERRKTTAWEVSARGLLWVPRPWPGCTSQPRTSLTQTRPSWHWMTTGGRAEDFRPGPLGPAWPPAQAALAASVTWSWELGWWGRRVLLSPSRDRAAARKPPTPPSIPSVPVVTSGKRGSGLQPSSRTDSCLHSPCTGPSMPRTLPLISGPELGERPGRPGRRRTWGAQQVLFSRARSLVTHRQDDA